MLLGRMLVLSDESEGNGMSGAIVLIGLGAYLVWCLWDRTVF